MGKRLSLQEADANFAVTDAIKEKKDIVFYDATEEPFAIHGLILPQNEEDCFRRIPEEVAKAVSDGVHLLHTHTSGGRIRFRTNSSYIAISTAMPKEDIHKVPHMPLTGSAGFDLYQSRDGEERYVGSFIPPFDIEDGYSALIECGGEHDYTINMPLYAGVSRVYIGLQKDALLLPCERNYKEGTPIVYYGSSITQGGCASRPGNCYQNIICRRLWCDYINLGFSGNAKAEPEMSAYIQALPMSVFVYDYDHNAPTAEHLRNTHGRMFREIRAAQPDLPIVMISRPQVHLSDEEKERLAIIKETYDTAVAAGDKNVYLIDGSKMLLTFGGDSGTVDNCHPTDLGFMCMAKCIGDVLEKIF